MVDAAELARILAAHGRPVDPGLAELGSASADGSIPALISPSLQSTAALVTPALLGAEGFVDLDVIGTVGDPPVLPANASTLTEAEGVVVVDREVFAAALADEVRTTTTWVDGPGAVAAVRDAGLAAAPGDHRHRA